MPGPLEHSSPKAARILAAAGELLVTRGSTGVTIAEVARRAHIGKGTVYLYWKTKEDLLLELLCRDFLDLADTLIAEITADPDLARPSRLYPRLLRNTAERPFVYAMQSGSSDLLGVLADDPRSARLLGNLGPDALTHGVLPIWRRHHLARTDWEPADQAFVLRALGMGFLSITEGRKDASVDRLCGAAVTALLGPEEATASQVEAAAAEGVQELAEARSAALAVISDPAPAVR
ncbi:TetR/AcrR family transcriptional regulator [Amycolatopsis jejuensis]|uniref:TetR/AcrR family transcriptional regulator n=1 Tax=Amycolatopsis jejuensis TaxID=330084 RepID=UPI00052661B2|nr:TetR/AcrR family transcriptional regulator [Amycolatopsis jejuensis]